MPYGQFACGGTYNVFICTVIQLFQLIFVVRNIGIDIPREVFCLDNVGI